MNMFTRDLIEYSGIEPYLDDECSTGYTSNFKQTNIDLEFCVPEQKPDIEQVVKVDITTKILKTRVVKTPKGTSLEGQIMTGYKLLILGEVKLKIRYVADEPEQSMHSFHAYIPFCDYIVLPETTCNIDALVADVYVEDIFLEKQNCRCLFSNLNILLVVETC
ncbi:MAG: SPOCS domain-containing protein [Clostridium sp.]